MDLIARNCGGHNLVGRPQARRAWYPPERVRPVRVEVWWRYEGEVAAAARYLGMFAPGQEIVFPFQQSVDRNLIFSVITISPNNLRSVRELADAHEVLLVYGATTTMRDRLEEKLAGAQAKHGAASRTVATGLRFPRPGMA